MNENGLELRHPVFLAEYTDCEPVFQCKRLLVLISIMFPPSISFYCTNLQMYSITHLYTFIFKKSEDMLTVIRGYFALFWGFNKKKQIVITNLSHDF